MCSRPIRIFKLNRVSPADLRGLFAFKGKSSYWKLSLFFWNFTGWVYIEFLLKKNKSKGHLTTFQEIMQCHLCACVNKYEGSIRKKKDDRSLRNKYWLTPLSSIIVCLVSCYFQFLISHYILLLPYRSTFNKFKVFRYKSTNSKYRLATIYSS